MTDILSRIDTALAANGATGDDPAVSPDAMAWTGDTTPRLPETQRRRRGHDFYPPNPTTVPVLYATDGQDFAEKMIYLHYFVGGCDWWIAEYDPATGEGFGYACLGDPQCAEWGYIDLPELEALRVQGRLVVERDLHWTPCRFGDLDRV